MKHTLPTTALLLGLAFAPLIADSNDDSDLAIYTFQSLKQLEKENPTEAWLQCQSLENVFPQELWPEEIQALFNELTFKIQENISKLLLKAEGLYEATLYAEAIPIYQEIVESLEKESFPKQIIPVPELITQSLCRIGQSYFYLEEYAPAIQWLEKPREKIETLPVHLQDLDKQAHYLLAISYRHQKQYDNAIAILLQYIQSYKQHDYSLNDEVQFELGLNYFLRSDLVSSKKHLELLSNKSHKPQIYYLSQLYLGRIDLADGDFLNAEKKLEALSHLIPKENILLFELAYLRGEAAFHIQDFPKAAEFFEQSLPKRNHEHAPWYPEALYQLGWSHVKIADDPSQSSEDQKKPFRQS